MRMKSLVFFSSSAVSIAFENAPFKSLILWIFPEIRYEVRDVKKGIFSLCFRLHGFSVISPRDFDWRRWCICLQF
ncbi:hypothetical protein NBRC3293_2836 [Gluconobacter oxydans NBRC 3293]|uniref:Uncharacterized protein n=1 Tax=Gluconobacter oxydans NBRC 3293 TaxID=1315969 RepID=A0A829XAD5_GLUOY|nr:hypothetical protein NBRC3293_2836 [Gluconobacter oxydans NBRC 3293]